MDYNNFFVDGIEGNMLGSENGYVVLSRNYDKANFIFEHKRGLELLRCQDSFGCSMNNFFSDLLIILSVLQFGILLGGLMVSVFVYKPYMEKQKLIMLSREMDDPPPKYEEKYPLEEAVGDNTIINENSFVMDCTPNGSVIMRYDEKLEGFVYWSDKSIPYKFLQTVARKYVTMNCCRDIYKGYEYIVDYDDEEDDGDNSSVDDVVEEKENVDLSVEEKKKDDDDVFVKYSKHNEKVKRVEETKNAGVKEANKFIHKGRISEFMVIKKPEIVEPKQALTFSDFKKMFGM